jgi:trans-aconitate methyltransferase
MAPLEDPELYMKSSELQFEDARFVMHNYGHRLNFKPHARILDVGCGPGSVTKDIIASYITW